MGAVKREAAGAMGSRSQVGLQVALAAAVILLLVSWITPRAPAAMQAPQPQLYINDLSLPLDVGALERQVRAAGRRRRPSMDVRYRGRCYEEGMHFHPRLPLSQHR